jgi:hypothetical protein
MHHRRSLSLVGFLLVLAFSLTALKTENVHSKPVKTIQTTDLELSLSDIESIDFGYHHSSFESTHIEFHLENTAGQLSDGNISAPLSSLQPLLAGLHGLYPGTRPLIWQRWTDDYPHAWINIHLKDNQVIQISSDSQYDGMYPWNISVWGTKEAVRPNAVYIGLNPDLLQGIDALWRGVGERSFPRSSYDPDFWSDIQEMIPMESLSFYIPVAYSGEVDGSATAPIIKANPGTLAPFLPLLQRNAELKRLFDMGYTLYDAALSLDVETTGLKPIQYTGSLALAAPDGLDAVAGLVTLPVEADQPVTVSFTAAEVERRIEWRKSSRFLNEAAQLLVPLTFIIDIREFTEYALPEFACAENSSLELDGQVIKAIWNPTEPQEVFFFPLSNDRWAVDLNIHRDEPGWENERIHSILQAWFPPALANLNMQDLRAISTHWGIAFQPGVTLRDTSLLDELKTHLPEQVDVHTQNPEKDGDYSYLQLKGRVVFPEEGGESQLVYCGENFPDWYGDPYPIEKVIPPADDASRHSLWSSETPNGTWTRIISVLPTGEGSTQWADISLSHPGFLHVLWTVDGSGVYYADGWVDGSGWTDPQRLGEEAWWLTTRAWPDGEVHLFWDGGLRTGGTMHVWRPAGGEWQSPEHWPDIGYFGEILRDPDGVLHIGAVESDGLDSEFTHWSWSPERGLSKPENISRHLGDMGGSGILRLDSQGGLHAAWSHVLEQETAPDPITGETPDISGVFYAYRLPDGSWARPEQIGIQAPYAHALSLELDGQDNPLVMWQTEAGLVSRIKRAGTWEEPVEFAKVEPPETPAEFGPDRWVQPTVEMQTGVNSKGEILAGWLIPGVGLKLAFWSENAWSDVVDIVPAEEADQLYQDPQTLKMVVGEKDQVDFVFFKGMSLHFSEYDHGEVQARPLNAKYTGYGLPAADLAIDSIGSIAVLGMPRSPSLLARLPLQDIPATPTAAPTATQAPSATPVGSLTSMLPTATLAPSPLPGVNSTPVEMQQDGSQNQLSSLLLAGLMIGFIAAGVLLFLLYKRSL